MLLNCSVAHRVAELFAALHHQHFVDGVDDHLRRDFRERLLQRRVAVGPQVRVLLPERGDLPLLEIGLGDDLAVHLDEHLLDDVGAAASQPPQRAISTQATTMQFCVSCESS